MNKPRPVYNKRTGALTGYKQEVKWRGQARYFTRRTAAAAEACWARAIADFEAGLEPYDRYRHAAPEPKDATPAPLFGDWVDEWHPKRHLGDDARKNQTAIIRARIKPDLGHLPLTAEGITQPHIQAWVWELEDEYSPRYVRTMLSVARVALRHAARDPAVPLTLSPVVEIQLEPLDSTGRVALTAEQVGAVVSRCGVHRDLFESMAFTGARIGELLKRDVEDWSWRTGLAIAARQAAPKADDAARKRKRGTRKAPASKTAAGSRTIELCASHAAAIRDGLDGRTSGPLYRGRDGRASRSAAYQMFVKAAAEARAAAKKTKVDVPEGLSPHWLRHTHKTWLRGARCDPVAIDERIGHKTGGMDGIYVHVTPAMRAEILTVLEARWAEYTESAVPSQDGLRRFA